MESKVKGPAIGLIVLGAIGVILGLLGILGIGGADPDDLAKLDEQTRGIMEMANKFGRGFGVLVLLASAFVTWGGLQMKKLSGWLPSLIACFVVMTPLVSCSCLLGVPIGIWGLVVLFNSEVKAAFGK